MPVNSPTVSNQSRVWIDGAVEECNRHSMSSCFKMDYEPSPLPHQQLTNSNKFTTLIKVKHRLTGPQNTEGKGIIHNVFPAETITACGRVEVQFHAFLTSALYAGRWSAPRTSRINPIQRAPRAFWRRMGYTVRMVDLEQLRISCPCCHAPGRMAAISTELLRPMDKNPRDSRNLYDVTQVCRNMSLTECLAND